LSQLADKNMSFLGIGSTTLVLRILTKGEKFIFLFKRTNHQVKVLPPRNPYMCREEGDKKCVVVGANCCAHIVHRLWPIFAQGVFAIQIRHFFVSSMWEKRRGRNETFLFILLLLLFFRAAERFTPLLWSKNKKLRVRGKLLFETV
jgi:hypothetical protein